MKEHITSSSNPKIKNVIKLLEKSSERKSQNLIVVEGMREINLSKESGFEIETLFVCDEIAKNTIPGDATVIYISKNVFFLQQI